MFAKIYVNETVIPYLTVDFQETVCRKVADLRAYTVDEVIIGTENLQKFITSKDYNTSCILIIYNLSILGETVKDILINIERFTKHNVELSSCFDDFALKTFGLTPEDNIFLTTIIALNVKNIELWKEIQRN